MKLSCSSCQSEIQSQNIDLNSGLAKCQRCHNVFSFRSQLGISEIGAKPDLQLPKNFTSFTDGLDLVLIYRWFSPKWIMLLVVSVFWLGFLFFFFEMGGRKDGGLPPQLLVGIPHILIGVGLFYGGIAGLLNKSEYRISNTSLRVRHGPLPWFGNRTIDRNLIDQIFVWEKVRRTKNGISKSYEVKVICKNSKEVKIASGLDGYEKARYIEQELEKALGIQDRSVKGEHLASNG